MSFWGADIPRFGVEGVTLLTYGTDEALGGEGRWINWGINRIEWMMSMGGLEIPMSRLNQYRIDRYPNLQIQFSAATGHPGGGLLSLILLHTGLGYIHPRTLFSDVLKSP